MGNETNLMTGFPIGSLADINTDIRARLSEKAEEDGMLSVSIRLSESFRAHGVGQIVLNKTPADSNSVRSSGVEVLNG